MGGEFATSTNVSMNKALSKPNKVVSKMAISLEKSGGQSSRGHRFDKTRNDQNPIDKQSDSESGSSSQEDESTSEYSETTLNQQSRLKTAIVGGSES